MSNVTKVTDAMECIAVWNDSSLSNVQVAEKLGYESFQILERKLKRPKFADLIKVQRSKTIDPTGDGTAPTATTQQSSPVEPAVETETVATTPNVIVASSDNDIVVAVTYNGVGEDGRPATVRRTLEGQPQEIFEALSLLVSKYSLGTGKWYNTVNNLEINGVDKLVEGASLKFRPVVRAG